MSTPAPGNFSNGILWRGNYEGLFSYSYSLDVPPITILDAYYRGLGPVASRLSRFRRSTRT